MSRPGANELRSNLATLAWTEFEILLVEDFLLMMMMSEKLIDEYLVNTSGSSAVVLERAAWS